MLRVVQRSIDLPLPAEAVWRRIVQGETFLYVARGLLGVANPEAVRGTFQPGQAIQLRLRLLHIIPVGRHELKIESVDSVGRVLRTCERSWLLPVWNHTLRVEATGADRSRYTDRIELDAGWPTPLAVPVVHAFFAYRQRRWRKLARETAQAMLPPG